MHRFLLVLAMFALAAPSIGCRLCSNPYDYCGPTTIGGRFEPCNPCARAGSILAPGFTICSGTNGPRQTARPHRNGAGKCCESDSYPATVVSITDRTWKIRSPDILAGSTKNRKPLFYGNADRKGAAHSHAALDRDRSSVRQGDVLDDGQPQAGSAEIVAAGFVNAVETLE